jgi:hypothetical protein
MHECQEQGMALRFAHAISSGYDPFDFGTEKNLGVCSECNTFTLVDFWGCCKKCKEIPRGVGL